jgi:hypothetical protein
MDRERAESISQANRAAEANLLVTENLRKENHALTLKMTNDNQALHLKLLDALVNSKSPPAHDAPTSLKRRLPREKHVKEPAPDSESDNDDDMTTALNMLVSGKVKMATMGLKCLKRMANADDLEDLDAIYDDMITSGADMEPAVVCAQVRVQNTQITIHATKYYAHISLDTTETLIHITQSRTRPQRNNVYN